MDAHAVRKENVRPAKIVQDVKIVQRTVGLAVFVSK